MHSRKLETTQPAKLMYTIEEAAQALNVSSRTLARLMARRAIPVVRVGRNVRLRLADLERFIEANVDGAA